MNIEELRETWKQEESLAHIQGWDFSHIKGRYKEEHDLPWSYDGIVRSYLQADKLILDYDTGGGEYLLTLKHPYRMTSTTEGYTPNVKLCKDKLLPLGIDFRECADPSKIPFDDHSFDLIINRHGEFDPFEIHRLLKSDAFFITQQVGCNNDRDLVEMVLPNTPNPFPHLYLQEQRRAFKDAGFEIIMANEAYRSIEFYDVGAFVWFARIIEWEFPGFSVDICFDKLLKMQTIIENTGKIRGSTHRYLLVVKK